MAEAVLVGRDDWECLVQADPEGIDKVLALTPNARALATDGAWPLIDPMTRYGDCAEARTVVRVQRARHAALQTLDPLLPAEREVLIDQINRVAYSAWRLWFTLGPSGPWLVPAGKAFELKTDRMAAYLLLLEKFLAPKMRSEAAALQLAPPPLAPLYRLFRRLALIRHPDSAARIVIGAAKQQFGLFQVFEQQDLKVRSLLVSTPDRGWREYLKLIREIIRNASAGGMVQVVLTGQADNAAAGLADRMLTAIADPIIQPGLAIYRDFLAYKLSCLPALRVDTARIVRNFKPHSYTAAEISGLSNYLLAEACGKSGAPRVVLSRNAHTPPEGALARDSSMGYFRARYPGDLVDEPLVSSPAGAALARMALPERLRHKIRPILARPVAPPLPRASGTRMVLLADTYAAWWFPHSFVFLTGDAFIAAARALAHAVSGLADTQLVIRAKGKPECDLAALTKLVAPPPNCEIKMRDVPFDEDLARADLLVSFHSTTIEEAIFARKPVLLWGGTSRYSFMPAREERPTAHDRAVLYRARKAAELPAMIQSILDVHTSRPLDDDELAPYRWPSETPDIHDLAREFVARAASSSTSRQKEAPLAPT
jgi:hypothetical protein